MNKSISSKNFTRKDRVKSTNNAKKKKFKEFDEIVCAIKEDIKLMTYEDSLIALDSILNDLQSDNISLDEIQKNYVLGNIYLKHCEKLLETVEQEIEEVDINEL